jgi:superfamily I DNA and RNA helicase
MDWKLPLRAIQHDFIERLTTQNLLDCPIRDRHSEITRISQTATKKIRDFAWEMVEKYRRDTQQTPQQIFINNVKGKLAEEAFQARIEPLVTPVNYERLRYGDGSVDFRTKTEPHVCIQVKARQGQPQTVRWRFSPEEIQKNQLLICILILEPVSEAQAEYSLIHAGFLPTNLIDRLPLHRPVELGIHQLLYCGGLRQYLEYLLSDQPPVSPGLVKPKQRVVLQLKQWIGEQDEQQKEIGFQIPPGPQRISGIAGSGKTVLLCQKAAQMYVRSEREGLDWHIALVFFTRSLYEPFIDCVDRWLDVLTNGEIRYDSNNPKFQVLHAWGSKDQPGLYSIMARAHHVRTFVDNSLFWSPEEKLAYLCKKLLTERPQISPQFDAVLIDEGQDLVIDNPNLLYQRRQAIYWLAWQSLRPISPELPNRRRLIWAYDEAQSLKSLIVPTASQVLGEELSQSIGGKQGSLYSGGIRKAYALKKCYRTPGQILMAAHAIGMGLVRPSGMLGYLKNKQDWQRLGYEVEGDFRKVGSTITLYRPDRSSPNPAHQYWHGQLLQFKRYDSRPQELEALVHNIQDDLDNGGLQPSRDLLVIILGQPSTSKVLESSVARTLMKSGIKIYLAGASGCNTIDSQSHPDHFWTPEAITLSRIHRAKGHEAFQVYIIGLDEVAKNEGNLMLRNQVFVAMTRTKAWVTLSGIGNYSFYDEVRQALDSFPTLSFQVAPRALDAEATS